MFHALKLLEATCVGLHETLGAPALRILQPQVSSGSGRTTSDWCSQRIWRRAFQTLQNGCWRIGGHASAVGRAEVLTQSWLWYLQASQSAERANTIRLERGTAPPPLVLAWAWLWAAIPRERTTRYVPFLVRHQAGVRLSRDEKPLVRAPPHLLVP